MIAVIGGHQHFEGTDKCYRIVGDFEDGESEVSRVVDTGWCKCVLTPRDWGVLDPV
jgi:hypothetical protein